MNILNSLIGSKNIEEDFERIISKYPETLQCVPLLLAVRGYEIYAQDEDGSFLYNFKKMNYIVAAGFKKDVNYFKEMYLKDIEEKWDINLSALSNRGKAAKRFDFVIKTDKMIYSIDDMENGIMEKVFA